MSDIESKRDDSAVPGSASSSAKSAVAAAPPKLDWKTRAAISVGGFVIRMLARTWRIRAVDRESFDANRAAGKGAIFTFWHGQMLPLVAEHHRPTTVLISDHRDGEIITQIVSSFGCRAVRGSSSKGAARALLQLSRTLNEGRDIAITPDGPRGPRHSFAPGAVVLSQRTGSPIVLLASYAKRVWKLNTWDGFEIPKPFAKVTVAYGKPFVVAADGAREAATDVDAVAAALVKLVERARAVGSQ
ncbi:MAG: lysophospholipid acyltransferase family protein [Gemmatimonadaceae bacterium]